MWMTWNGGKMFEALKEQFFPPFGMTAIVVFFTVFLVFVLVFKPTAVQGVEIHNMPNGVTCYTFKTSIDCLQVEK